MFTELSERLRWSQRLLELQPGDDDTFGQLALELYRWQSREGTLYHRMITGLGHRPDRVQHWSEIPLLPQAAFKHAHVTSHDRDTPPSPNTLRFLTSGTTGEGRGRHEMRDDSIYRALSCARVPMWQAMGDSCSRASLVLFTQSPERVPESSLTRMLGYWGEQFTPHRTHFLGEGATVEQQERLAQLLTQAHREAAPVAIAAPAFAWIPWLDTGRPWHLPSGSWLMETGGFKGRVTAIAKSVFYQQLCSTFCVPDSCVWNEYGMTELTSQAYARGSHGRHQAPPWTRLRVLSFDGSREVAEGEEGLVAWIDLGNVDSVLAIQTLDRARRHPDGIELLGRLDTAPARGCSLSAESWLLENKR